MSKYIYDFFSFQKEDILYRTIFSRKDFLGSETLLSAEKIIQHYDEELCVKEDVKTIPSDPDSFLLYFVTRYDVSLSTEFCTDFETSPDFETTHTKSVITPIVNDADEKLLLKENQINEEDLC